jgi:co-chaperonin GroES (HSP10)
VSKPNLKTVETLPAPSFVQSATVAEARALAQFKWTPEHDFAFPDVDPGIDAVGSRVLVQIRTPKTKTRSGIYLTPDTKETELWNTQIGLIRQVGPLAYRNRNTMEMWPEGPWCSAGQFVRVPKYGGDRWQVPTANGEFALFVIFKEVDVVGRVRLDPLDVKAFI